MRFTKTEQLVLDVIDGKKNFSILKRPDGKGVTKIVEKAIDTLIEAGMIYKGSGFIFYRTFTFLHRIDIDVCQLCLLKNQ